MKNNKEAQEQITEQRKRCNYDTREYRVHELISKHKKDFLPTSFNRWNVLDKSDFIETIFLNLPIPFFIAINDQDCFSIVDGHQRIRTLIDFYTNKFELTGLSVLDKLNGFTFSDLSDFNQERFLRKSLRFIEMDKQTVRIYYKTL